MAEKHGFLLPTTPNQWREAVEYFCEQGNSPQSMAHGIVLRELLAIAKARTTWIPVGERLPHRGCGNVLVLISWKPAVRRCVAFYSHDEQAWIRQMCDRLAGELPDGEVTHWMPLPEPPTDVD